MKPGGIRRLYIPAALAYGPKGFGADIPPNADLVFEIKLLHSK
jgi:FKBP-type peptidyl-prolyl cis-trans isomerase